MHEGLPSVSHRHLRERRAGDGGGRIDEIYCAPDPSWAPTERRKPGAGMLREAMAHFRVAPADTVFIGDSLTDLQAGTKAGCRRILVRTGRSEEHTSEPQSLMRISYAACCLKKKTTYNAIHGRAQDK